ncbi:hypothetical protein QBC37DRAFT_483803 [Rhypophila decipiens]|uniref:Glycan binding protein Y3-like domain-containing protein n=1 Tax=Rhypophila decipiens TaxID=261697 RepID=A0AAN6Y6Z3_9PEZI|nr:hypothetical protein QBC37DRAFT_483803 [Rhypophila decipiens]
MSCNLFSKLIFLLSLYALTPVSATQFCFTEGPLFSDLTSGVRDLDSAIYDFCNSTASSELRFGEDRLACYTFDNDLQLELLIANVAWASDEWLSNAACVDYYRNETQTCPHGGVENDDNGLGFVISPASGGCLSEKKNSAKNLNGWKGGRKG